MMHVNHSSIIVTIQYHHISIHTNNIMTQVCKAFIQIVYFVSDIKYASIFYLGANALLRSISCVYISVYLSRTADIIEYSILQATVVSETKIWMLRLRLRLFKCWSELWDWDWYFSFPVSKLDTETETFKDWSHNLRLRLNFRGSGLKGRDWDLNQVSLKFRDLRLKI